MSSLDTVPYGLIDPEACVDPWGQVAETASITLRHLLMAYRHGVFPWTDHPVGWFCPAERAILPPLRAHFPSNLPRLCRKARFEVRADTRFAEVVAACARAHAAQGVWLTPRFRAAYQALHRRGHAHSLEIFADGQLVGGLYGVQVGRVFCAESMFGAVNNASKAAVYALCQHRAALGVELVDTQVLTPATEQLGAMAVPRSLYLQILHALGPQGTWQPTRWPSALGQPSAGASTAPA